MHSRSILIFTLSAIIFVAGVAAPASASVPFYNRDLGYTIWLSKGWSEVPEGFLSRYKGFQDGLEAQAVSWQAGYTFAGSDVSLLVSELPGRVVSKTGIGNFNRFVVRELKRRKLNPPSWSDEIGIRLTKASYDARKKSLRLEMDRVGLDGRHNVAVVYIVYTSECMLKFVGLTEPGDEQGVAAIDKAVSSLYLDRGLSH